MMLKLSTCLRNAIAMFALVLAFTVNSFAQEASMERFDIELFNRNKTGQLMGVYTKYADTTRSHLLMCNGFYTECDHN